MTVGLGLSVVGVRRVLAGEGAVGSVVVVVVLPLLQLVGEQAGVVDDLAFKEPVELFGVDAVGSLDAPMFVKPLWGWLVRMAWPWPVVEGCCRSRGRCSASVL
jgi:hypothetical protein